MSVERRVNSSGDVMWRVRWRAGNRNRANVLGRKADAIAFDAEVRRRARTGALELLDAGVAAGANTRVRRTLLSPAASAA